MRIAIYGAGSLGTVIGAFIEKNASSKGLDIDLELFNRNKAHVEALNKNGAQIVGELEFVQKVKAYLPEQISGIFDYIILMTKQLDNEKVVRLLETHLSKDGAICTVQNGLPEKLIADIVGPDRTVGCTIGWGATMLGPGVSKLTSSADRLCCDIGTMDERANKHLFNIKEVLELMGPVNIKDNFLGARWSKLLINASFSGMSAVIGDSFGAVCDNKKARSCAQAVIKECIDVSRALGVKIESVQGKDIVKLFDYNNKLKKYVAFMLIPIAMKRHRNIMAGMLIDIRNNKPCEVDAINGIVCQVGKEVNVKTPYCDKIVELIHGFESGKGSPSYENLKSFDGLNL